MSADERAAYLQLIELIEHDLSLAGEGRYDELAASRPGAPGASPQRSPRPRRPALVTCSSAHH